MGRRYEREPAASLFDDGDAVYRPSPQQHPPYTVLDAAGGWWQHRRAYWRDLGHRDAGARPRLYGIETPTASVLSGNEEAASPVSQFSPVLAELLIAWYAADTIYDPFAGGPTRGWVATKMGRVYRGVELSAAQIDANVAAYPDLASLWEHGDAATDDEPGPVDCVLTCPPYHDVEVYSTDPADLSAMTWTDFARTHLRIVEQAAYALAPGGFAVWVVGDFRAPDGSLRGFPDLVAAQMELAGLARWNRHVVRQPLVTAQMRYAQAWRGQKATTTHAEVIVGRRP